METGPRKGDILLSNPYTPGSSAWHEVESNNTLYHERERRIKNYNSPPSKKDALITELVKKYKGKSLTDFLVC